MATIKSFTDLQQSKKLTEILPFESADMIWDLTNPDLPTIRAIPYEDSDYNNKYLNIVPCWSLAALLGVLPRMSLEREKFFYNKSLYNSDYTYRVIVNKYTDNNIFGRLENNPIDACYEMILNLHELNKL